MKWIAAAAMAVGLTAGSAQASVIYLTEDSSAVAVGYFQGKPYTLSFTIDLPPGGGSTFDVTFSTPFVVDRPYYGALGYFNPIETTTGSFSPATITGVYIYGPEHDSQAFYVGGPYDVRLTEVPEPATWAMMLVGFGLLGRSLRRSRSMATL